MTKYLVLAGADEDKRHGRLWDIVEAHSPPAAVEEVMGDAPAKPNEKALVFEIKEPATEVEATVTWE